MITKFYYPDKTETAAAQQYLPSFGSCVFFDIETTGFSPASALVYLIGMAACLDGRWVITQYMIQAKAEEPLLLDTFLKGIPDGCTLVCFNGDRFDLPFLAGRCQKYGLSLPSRLETLDLFRTFRPLKKLLNLAHMNQKSLELFLELEREDMYDGGRLIPVFRRYLETHAREDEALLLLHNREDVLGMFSVLKLFAFFPLLRGEIGGCHGELLEPLQLKLSFSLAQPLPVRWSRRLVCGYLTVHGVQGTVLIQGIHETLKYFFPDYRNYYYLPDEDQAIHKSVAVFVDKEHRRPAKASTCYIRSEGDFFWEPEEIASPTCKRDYKDDQLFFRADDKFLTDSRLLSRYIANIIAHGLSN